MADLVVESSLSSVDDTASNPQSDKTETNKTKDNEYKNNSGRQHYGL